MNPDTDPLGEETPVPVSLLEQPGPATVPTEVVNRSVGPWPFLADPGTAPPPAASPAVL